MRLPAEVDPTHAAYASNDATPIAAAWLRETSRVADPPPAFLRFSIMLMADDAHRKPHGLSPKYFRITQPPVRRNGLEPALRG
jgi:hypothetical protein